MRAFIAIEISDEAKDSLDQIESQLRHIEADVKWVDPDNIHLTLKFLGDINDAKAKEISDILDRIARESRSYEIILKGIGAFMNLDHPRVIWVGIGHGLRETVDLASRIDEGLSGIGFEKNDEQFTPHITIGRVRSSRNQEKLKSTIASMSDYNCLSLIESIKVRSIILFQSTLSSRGPYYQKLHESFLR